MGASGSGRGASLTVASLVARGSARNESGQAGAGTRSARDGALLREDTGSGSQSLGIGSFFCGGSPLHCDALPAAELGPAPCPGPPEDCGEAPDQNAAENPDLWLDPGALLAGGLGCCSLDKATGSTAGGMPAGTDAATSARVEDIFEFDHSSPPLGRGSYSLVYAGYLKDENQTKVAIKLMDKATLREKKVPTTMVVNEVRVLRECAGHERFVQLYGAIETDMRYFLLLERVEGGSLDVAVAENQGSIGERQVRALGRQMLEALSFLHSRSICHRDVKPHNYLVVKDICSEAVQLKLCDFGMAIRIPSGNLAKQKLGTPVFMAPEMHLLPRGSPGYDHKVDVWAIGVCLVFFFAHEYPFVDSSGKLLRQRIIKGDVPLWEANSFKNLFRSFKEVVGLGKKQPSKMAQDLIMRLLTPKREDRATADEALQHPWFHQPAGQADGDVSGWEAFEESLSNLERDINWAVDMLNGGQDDDTDSPEHWLGRCRECGDPLATGYFGHICPQCKHVVCVRCLRQFPKANCPHCRCSPQGYRAVCHMCLRRFPREECSYCERGPTQERQGW